MAMTVLTDEERDFIRDIIQGLNPMEDLIGAMLSRTDVVTRFRDDNSIDVELFVVTLAGKLSDTGNKL